MPDIFARMKVGISKFDEQKKEAFATQLLVAILPTITQYCYSKAEKIIQSRSYADMTQEQLLEYEVKLVAQTHSHIRIHCNAIIDGFCQDFFPNLYEKRQPETATTPVTVS